MEWLVFYTTCGDGYTYSYDKFIPFQFSSKKDRKLKIEDIGMDFPEIYTLQEWAEAKEEKVKYLQKDV